MGLPAAVDVQNIPVSSETNTLSTTTIDVAIPTAGTPTLVMVWCSLDAYCAITASTAIDLDASNAALLKANTTYLFRLNRARLADGSLTHVNVEARLGSGTYEVSFLK